LKWEEALSEYCVTNLGDKSYSFFWQLLQNLITYQVIAWALSGIQYSDCSSRFFDRERPCKCNYFSKNIDMRKQLILLLYGDFICVELKDLGEMRGEFPGLFFVISDSSLILLSDRWELYLRAFKPLLNRLNGFPQRIIGFWT